MPLMFLFFVIKIFYFEGFMVSGLKNSVMALKVAPVLCPFTIVSNIFTLKKDIAKQHYDNVLDNASLAVYQVTLARR